MGEGRRIPQAKGRKLKAVDTRRIDRAIRDHALLEAGDAFDELRAATLKQLALHREDGPLLDDATTPTQTRDGVRQLKNALGSVERALDALGAHDRDMLDDFGARDLRGRLRSVSHAADYVAGLASWPSGKSTRQRPIEHARDALINALAFEFSFLSSEGIGADDYSRALAGFLRDVLRVAGARAPKNDAELLKLVPPELHVQRSPALAHIRVLVLVPHRSGSDGFTRRRWYDWLAVDKAGRASREHGRR